MNETFQYWLRAYNGCGGNDGPNSENSQDYAHCLQSLRNWAKYIIANN